MGTRREQRIWGDRELEKVEDYKYLGITVRAIGGVFGEPSQESKELGQADKRDSK